VKRRRRSVAAAALVVSAALAPRPAAAQTSIEVSPLRIEVQALPGGSSTQSIMLTNVGTQPVRVRASLSDWFLSRDGAPQFEDPGPARAFTASGWVRFAPPEFVIEGGRQGTVRFTLTVPPGIEPAGYRTGLLFDLGRSRSPSRAASRHSSMCTSVRPGSLLPWSS
jgi:P pilus assembly chaperone PapD